MNIFFSHSSLNQILGIVFLGLLISCGGGSGNSSTPTQNPTSQLQFGADQKFSPPAFGGSKVVGSIPLHWIDVLREEPLTTEAGDQRELMVRIFYPTDEASGDLALPVIRDEELASLTNQRAIANHALRPSNYSGVNWPIIENATLSDDLTRYPVVIYSHGGGGALERNLFIIADIASRGFVVLAINHTFYADFVHFPDGRVETSLGFGLNNDGIVDSNEAQALADIAELWSADQLFAYNQLLSMDQDASNQFDGRLDFSRIATAGYSFGGFSSYLSASADARIATAINVDGGIFTNPAPFLGVPFLYIQNEAYDHSIFNNVGAPSYAAVFDGGINHGAFNDFSLFWRWDFPALDPYGSLGGEAALRTTTELMNQFLRKTLDGDPAPILDDDAQVPAGVLMFRF